MKNTNASYRKIYRAALTATVLLLLQFTSSAFAQSGWTTKAPLPTSGQTMAAAAINGIVYVAGGNNGSPMANVQAYNTTNNTWSSLTALPGVRYQNDGMAVISNKLYFPGGWTTSPPLPNNNLWVYDPVANTWDTTRAAMPLLSGNGASGVISNKLYVTTPDNGFSGYYSFLHVYDPGANAWTALANSPRPHHSPAYGVIGNKLYVAGGYDAANTTNILDVYDPVANTWTTKAPMLVSRQGPGSTVINGKLYVFGGLTPAGTYLNSVEVYDPVGDLWTTELSMPTSRAGIAAAAVNGVPYVTGGGNSTNSFLPTVEALTPTVAPVFRFATYLGAASSDVSGTGIKYAGGSVYASANSTTTSGLLAGYPTPLGMLTAPTWSVNWPDSTPSDQFNAVVASSSGIYADGSDYTRTTDTVGGKEGKGLEIGRAHV